MAIQFGSLRPCMAVALLSCFNDAYSDIYYWTKSPTAENNLVRCPLQIQIRIVKFAD